MSLKVSYNAPVVLTFSLICTAVFFVPFTTTSQELSSPFGHLFILEHSSDYLSMLLYVFGHASVDHLLGNLSFILLLGSMIEEKYGSLNLLIMIGITAIATGILNIVFFSTGLLGASGIVFLFIILASFGNAQKGIPLTFILIAILFLGKEVFQALQDNNISEFAHILGGICGSLFGFSGLMTTKKKETSTFDMY
ncbi:MAG: rhomboid family intramembrane serine protease [Saprospiraceae bacterium]|nr:rhomboid family intramembrane serine protease [Saprospiraceae bacterium]